MIDACAACACRREADRAGRVVRWKNRRFFHGTKRSLRHQLRAALQHVLACQCIGSLAIPPIRGNRVFLAFVFPLHQPFDWRCTVTARCTGATTALTRRPSGHTLSHQCVQENLHRIPGDNRSFCRHNPAPKYVQTNMTDLKYQYLTIIVLRACAVKY